MDRRTLFFVIAISWVFVIYMMFFGPKPPVDKPDADDPANVAKKSDDAEAKPQDDSSKDDAKKEGDQDQESKKEGDENSDPQKPDDANDGDPKKSGESKSPDQKSADQKSAEQKSAEQKSAEQKSAEQKADENSNSDQTEDSATKDEPSKEKLRDVPQQLITLGSLDPKSPYRFLATFDTEAASLRRLELVQRHRNSEQFRYKDLEVKYGYIGHLDLISTDAGMQIRTVAPQSPADLAGIEKGDILLRINGIKIEYVENFYDAMEATKAGETINVDVMRDGAELKTKVDAIHKPLEVIRPEAVPADFAWAFEKIRQPKSYSISLFNPTGTLWKKIDSLETDTWEPEVTEDTIKFYYPFKDPKKIKEFGKDYQVIKTFRMIANSAEELDDVTAQTYHLDFQVEIKNLSDEPRGYAYRVDGPNGMPTEDWWFAIKIHGEWSAMFSAAGARDVVASTEANTFQFIGGPKIYTNGTKKAQRDELPLIRPGDQGEMAHALKFVGVDSHYFVSALIPSEDGEKLARQAYSAYAMPQSIPLKGDDSDAIDPQRRKEAGWYRKLVPVNFKAYFQVDNPDGESAGDSRYILGPGESNSHEFMIFAGPKEPTLLRQYEIGDCVTYGWFAAFSWPLVSLLHLFHAIIGNYAIAIILLTILVRLAMMRFSRKMVINSQMMQVLAPEIKALTERHKDDFQAKSRAQQELFRKYNYNPFSGCLVMLIQLPVFIGLYRGLSVDIALRDAPLIPGVQWCSNLAGPDQLWRWQEDLPSFLSFLTHETGWLGPYFNLLPIISVVLMLIQQRLFTPPAADEQQAMMQKVMTFMMVFIGVIFFKVPAGLCIYFITSTLWAILEKKLVPPPKLPLHLQQRLDQIKELQAKEKEDGVPAGTYTNAMNASDNSSGRKHTERAKKKSQKNRRKK